MVVELGGLAACVGHRAGREVCAARGEGRRRGRGVAGVVDGEVGRLAAVGGGAGGVGAARATGRFGERVVLGDGRGVVLLKGR